MSMKFYLLPFAVTLVSLYPATALAQLGECSKLVVPYQDRKKIRSDAYSLDLRAPNGGQLAYLGSKHTRDPNDPQFELFERAWKKLTPTIAFYEGTDTLVRASCEEAIKLDGEPGLVRFLARRDHVPAASLEPNRQDEIDFLLKTFSAEQVKLFYVLRVIAELRERNKYTASDLKGDVSRILDRFTRYRGLDTVMRSDKDLEDAYRRYWKSPEHWWEAPTMWFNPLVSSSATGGVFTNEANQASSTFRDVHMFELISKSMRDGEKIFAVVGRDHIPMQEAALKCATR
jgi:hypothetical protein